MMIMIMMKICALKIPRCMIIIKKGDSIRFDSPVIQFEFFKHATNRNNNNKREIK